MKRNAESTPDSRFPKNGKETLAILSRFRESGERTTSDSQKREGTPTLKGRVLPPTSRVGKGATHSPSTTPQAGEPLPASDQEKNPISFFWQGVPPRSTAQTRRHTRAGATYRTPANLRAVATLRAVVEPFAPRMPLDGPVGLEATFTFPRPSARVLPRTQRPDADNLAKDLLDALQWAGYFADDAQVARLSVAKFNGPIPGIYINVSLLDSQK